MTNNGGIDFTMFAAALGIDVGEDSLSAGPARAAARRARRWRDRARLGRAPGPQRSRRGARRHDLLHRPAAHGGRRARAAKGASGATRAQGELREIARGFQYDNGVALSPEGRVLIVEGRGCLDRSRERRVASGGSRSCPATHPATASPSTRRTLYCADRWTTASASSTQRQAGRVVDLGPRRSHELLLRRRRRPDALHDRAGARGGSARSRAAAARPRADALAHALTRAAR